MNKLITILAAVALATIWLPASAEILTDEQLEQIYAGQTDPELEIGADINYLGEGEVGCSAYSAVAAQSNIGAVVAGEGNADEIKIINLNDLDDETMGGTLFNMGDSAVALQSNIGAVVAEGDIGITPGSVTIDNDNLADVFNIVVDEEIEEGGVEGSSIDVETPCGGGTVNYADVEKSAVVAQSNIAAAVATGSDIDHLKINNYNWADVDNFGDSAVALQSNIAAVVSCDGNIGQSAETVTIDNKNVLEEVDNRYCDVGGSVDASSVDAGCEYAGAAINCVYATNSAVAAQSNIGAVVTCGGSVSNTTIKNTNTATVMNNPCPMY